MRNKIAVVLILGLTAAAGISSYIAQGTLARTLKAGPFVVTASAKAIPLNSESPSQNTVGALTYVAGWALSSDNDDFGGWSAMVLGDGAKSFTAVSDQGVWLTANIDKDAPSLLSHALFYPFENGDQAAGSDQKKEYDAESLVRTENGFLVGLEQNHRILAVDEVGGISRRSVYDSLIDLSGLSANGGIEAMTLLPDGRLLAFAEHGLDINGTLPVWLAGKSGAVARRFAPPQNYSPTDAAALPNGDILLLMRYFSPIEGVSAKVLLISAAEIASGKALVGRELAHLASPLSVDNMEALDVILLPDGSVRLYMMSDDNFNPFQRTLLMVFDWKPEIPFAPKTSPAPEAQFVAE